jgi:hypothetical protein
MYSSIVPGNSSRFFDNEIEARKQPHGQMLLDWDAKLGLFKNYAFDETLISHDAHYCTSVVEMNGKPDIPTSNYICDLIEKKGLWESQIVDIGCGQGEFVEWLRSKGLKTIGFDPVLNNESNYLVSEYWTPSSAQADLFVMRCVLPHISGPWEFLNSLFEANPNSKVLIEFQDLKWILSKQIWWQISHDHVNSFTVRDFDEKYDLEETGSFSNGEWSWVLISKQASTKKLKCATNEGETSHFSEKLMSLEELRSRSLEVVRSLAGNRLSELVIWGAAGKGIVLADAMSSSEIPGIIATDSDVNRWGKYLECSGVFVRNPNEIAEILNAESFVIVSNPNHVEVIKRWVNSKCEVGTFNDLTNFLSISS